MIMIIIQMGQDIIIVINTDLDFWTHGAWSTLLRYSDSDSDADLNLNQQ